MKVAFWSNGRGRSCVTSNLACVSVLSALNCPKERTIVFENHKNIVNLGSTLYNQYSGDFVKESTKYQTGSGLGKVLRLMEQGKSKDKSALDEIREVYGFPTAAIVTMEEVVERLYNRECQGKVVIDDAMKKSIEEYYKQYGVQ